MSKSNKISFSLNAGGGRGSGRVGHGGGRGYGRGGYGRYPYGYLPIGYPYGYPVVVYDEEGVDAVEGATDFKHDVGNTGIAGGLNLDQIKNKQAPRIVIKNPVKTETEMQAAKKEIEIAAEKGALNQEQANSIAQQIYLTQQMEMSAKFSQGYVSPSGKWLEQLKGSGFEYKKVPATVNVPLAGEKEGLVMVKRAASKPEHGEAVRIVSVAAETKAVEETPKIEEAKVSGGNTALYVVGGVVIVAAIAYFGYPYLAKMAEKKHH